MLYFNQFSENTTVRIVIVRRSLRAKLEEMDQKTTEVISKDFMRSLTVILISFALLVTQFGCATIPVPPPPLSEETRATLGTIGIVSARFIPEVKLQKPRGKMSGFAAGAGEGALAVGGGGHCQGFGCVFALALIPVGALVGGISGAVKGVSAEEKKKAEDALEAALKQLKIQEALRNRILDIGRAKTTHNIILVEEGGPVSSDEKVSYVWAKSKGIDTILEVNVMKFGLNGPSEANPPLEFFMSIQIRLVKVTDGSVLYANKFHYVSFPHKFIDWAQDNARLFSEECDRAYQSLAEKTVEELFMLYDLPLNPSPS